MTSLKVWAVNLAFCAIVSLSFCMYGLTFRRVQGVALSTPADGVRFAFSVLTDPYFVVGLGLALVGSLLRVVMMRWLDIGRVALASEVTLVMTLFLTWVIFGTQLRFPRDYLGAALILVGSVIVAR